MCPTPIAEYSSQRSHTAIHEQQGAGDVGGIVGGQKQDRGGDLLSPAWALQHGALCGLGVILLDGPNLNAPINPRRFVADSPMEAETSAISPFIALQSAKGL